MEQRVRVRETYPDGTALVLHIRKSACSGDCHACSGCGAAQEQMLFRAVNAIGARAGDFVTVTSETGPVLKAAAILYTIPLVLFFLGYLLGAWWHLGGIAGCIGFALGIALAVLYGKRMGKKEKTVYTITGFSE